MFTHTLSALSNPRNSFGEPSCSTLFTTVLPPLRDPCPQGSKLGNFPRRAVRESRIAVGEIENILSTVTAGKVCNGPKVARCQLQVRAQLNRVLAIRLQFQGGRPCGSANTSVYSDNSFNSLGSSAGVESALSVVSR